MHTTETIQSQPRRTLNSWKEIGDYLKRDSRTAQRWERDKGLPVHRVPGGKRAAIYAFVHEIDAWLSSATIDASPLTEEISPSLELPRPNRIRYVWAFSIVALIVSAAVLFQLYARREHAHVARVAVHGNLVYALDLRDRELWHYKLQPSAPIGTAENPGSPPYFATLADANKDGTSEVLIGHSLGASSRQFSTEIICLNHSGKLIWSYRPAHHLVFGNQEYRDPWALRDMLVLDNDLHPVVFAVLNSPSWPSMIVRIDARTGDSALVFVNSGPLHLLEKRRIASRESLLVGGFNVEANAPFLAILDPFGRSVSPQSEPQYQLNDRSFVPAQFYIVLPSSEFSQSEHTNPQVVAFSVGDAHLQVTVREPNAEHLNADRVFTFQDDGRISPLAVRFSPEYWSYHEILERNHTLNHRRQDCPMLKPQQIRVNSNGSTSVAIGQIQN